MFLETLSCCYLYLCALQTAKEEEEKSFLCIEAGALHCLRLDPSSRNKKIEKKKTLTFAQKWILLVELGTLESSYLKWHPFLSAHRDAFSHSNSGAPYACRRLHH